MVKLRSFWARLAGPTKVGLAFALIAIVLTVVGQLRNAEQVTARSLLLGMLIGGGSWGLVSWAIAYAAWDVERELAEEETDCSLPQASKDLDKRDEHSPQ